ncbi:MAG: hypothetical protein F4Y03_02615 [Alphaproteobacteria bacterium]|nr:hypothetical protein [Alphaproteobacteria bacterium]
MTLMFTGEPLRILCITAVAIPILNACSRPAPVVDMQILRCPTEAVAAPECKKPPSPGTERDQGDVFANELACYRQTLAWRLGWKACGE